jgi:hypothetical protein
MKSIEKKIGSDAKAICVLEYNGKQCVVLQTAVVADVQGSLSRDKLRKANCGAVIIEMSAVHRLTQLEWFAMFLSQSDCRITAL